MNNQRFNLQSFALGHESSKKFTLINLNFLKHENGQLSIISQINEMKTKRSELCDNKKLYYWVQALTKRKSNKRRNSLLFGLIPIQFNVFNFNFINVSFLSTKTFELKTKIENRNLKKKKTKTKRKKKKFICCCFSFNKYWEFNHILQKFCFVWNKGNSNKISKRIRIRRQKKNEGTKMLDK